MYVYKAPAEAVTLGIGYRRRGQKKTRMIGLTDGRKSFQIGFTVKTQYRRVTDIQPASQPRFRSKYTALTRSVARVNNSSFIRTYVVYIIPYCTVPLQQFDCDNVN